MAFKDTWRRSLEYFGLVEGDYIEEGEYVDEHDTGQDMTVQETAVAPREAAPVTSLRGGRRGRSEEIDDIFGEDEAPRRGRLRPVEQEPASRRSRGNGGSDFSMHVVTPRSFNDAQQVADEFKASKPVIINLQNTDRELSKRLIDFASGMTYALGGGMQRVSQGIFLLTPANVEVSAEERARILEGGFFNQS
ncbi:MAG: cell division protein SepF [Actinomycetota bacterium]|nr:cell division protein SepF [Actinomycetota bacterium]